MFLFLILSLPELAKVKIRQKLQISFRQIPKQKQHHLKVQTKRFHLSGGSPHLSCKRDQIKMRDYMDRRVTPPKRVTSPTWGPPPPCKQALRDPISVKFRQATWP